jgi:putative AlgH/UPF0301 family transcriptional regulator
VVLVTQTEDGGTVGVIVNRPSTLKLQQLLSREFDTSNYREPVYAGGPVMRQALVVLFRADTTPKAPAFHVLKGVYLTMHPDNIAGLLAQPRGALPDLRGIFGLGAEPAAERSDARRLVFSTGRRGHLVPEKH